MRRETGKESVVKVHCDEREAVDIGPEPCAGLREGVGEALAGERTGVWPRHSFARRPKVRDRGPRTVTLGRDAASYWAVREMRTDGGLPADTGL